MSEKQNNSRRVFPYFGNLTIPLGILSLFPAFFFGYILTLDRDNVPLCDKQALVAVDYWFLEHKSSSELPNVKGDSSLSLAQLFEGLEVLTGWQTKYQYIPGLQKGDPGDLVVMYLKTPTRWVHHAAGPSSRFEHAYWMVTPFDFTGVADPKIAPPVRRDIPARGECSERLTDKEFAARLRKTLKYLQDNNRPNWQTVVAENEKLLSSLEKE